MKEFIYQLETQKMGIHFISFVIYLVVISWRADKFHKLLKQKNRRTKLKGTQEKKLSLTPKEQVSDNHPIFVTKRNSFLIIIILGSIHEIISWAKITNFGSNSNSSLIGQLFIPPICVGASIIILVIIFWLKGKGGGVPDFKFLPRSWRY